MAANGLVAGTVIAAVTLSPVRAEACTCGGRSTEFLAPLEGESIPPDAAFVAVGWTEFGPVLDWLGAPVTDMDVELIGSEGGCSPLVTVLRPHESLAPGERYHFVYDRVAVRTFEANANVQSAAEVPALTFAWEKNLVEPRPGGTGCDPIPKTAHSYMLHTEVELAGDEPVVLIDRNFDACGKPSGVGARVIQPGTASVDTRYLGRLFPGTPYSDEEMRQFLDSGCVEFEVLNRFGQTIATDHACPPADASEGTRGDCPDYVPPVYDDPPAVVDAGIPARIDAGMDMEPAPTPLDAGPALSPGDAQLPPPTGGSAPAQEPMTPQADPSSGGAEPINETVTASSGCSIAGSSPVGMLAWLVTALMLGVRRHRRS